MSIEQFAAAQGYPNITRYTLPDKSHVYKLYDKSETGKVGLPCFAIATANGWKLANPDGVIKILNILYPDD